FGAAAPAPRIRFHNAAFDHRPLIVDTLSCCDQSELVDSGESGHIGRIESRVEHVEVLLVGSVRTSIIERPRPFYSAPLRTASSPPSSARSPLAGPSAAIAELAWIDPAAIGPEVAPLSVEVLSKFL